VSSKVHIVCSSFEGSRILPRMARMLRDHLGWTLSSEPDPTADLNYAFPYLELRHKHDLPMISLFTHREDTAPKKVTFWDRQAARSRLRICWTPMYEEDLKQHGLTRRILPPLDRDFFAPVSCASARSRYSAKLAVGVSGFVYGGGRKGEGLVEEVLHTKTGKQFAWNAIGRGWPVPTHGVPYQKLAEWYSSLDIYFCPSLIEGIPYGPLEALACGIPVVIPRHVGLLDDLPDVPGIVRYDAGDAESATQAFAELAGSLETVRRDELRTVTEPYTIEGWIKGHVEAVNSLETTATVSPTARKSRRGIYVVAYGDKARECARRLIKSVHQHMPGIPVAVASEMPLQEADLYVTHPDADLGGRIVKTKMYELTPASWEEVLYLDADTELIADVSFLFDALSDGWELVLTKDQDDYDLIYSLWRRDSGENRLGREAIGSSRALQLAGGVIGFRRTKATERFFSEWVREWFKLGRRDQGALIRALYTTPVRMLVLGCHWNSFGGIFEGETAGILHHRGGPARRLRGWRAGRLDDPYGMRDTTRLQSYWESGKAPHRRSSLKDAGKDKRSSYWGVTGLPKTVPQLVPANPRKSRLKKDARADCQPGH